MPELNMNEVPGKQVDVYNKQKNLTDEEKLEIIIKLFWPELYEAVLKGTLEDDSDTYFPHQKPVPQVIKELAQDKQP